MNQYDLAVIGGGAAGLASAAAASSIGDRVIILEGGNAIGRKILASGNGRCNLMNTGEPRYYGDSEFAARVLEHCGAEEQKRFWHSLGLLLSEEDEEHRVYPCTYQSASVVDALKTALKANGAEIKLNAPVSDCRKDPGGMFRIQADGREITARRVIVATGSPAGMKTSAADGGYGILRAFGHGIRPLREALVPLTADPRSISGLAGIRVRCAVTLKSRNGDVLHREKGEVLFTETGISGICVMQCARFITEGCAAELDLTERVFGNEQEFREELEERRKRFAERTPDALLNGILPARLSYAVMKQSGVPMKGERLRDLDDGTFEAVIRTAGHYRIGITGTRGMENAQVCSGGADCGMFRSDNLESRIVPGLHAAGEALDTDGDCGGFNLMFAFGSGILAGMNGRQAAGTTAKEESPK